MSPNLRKLSAVETFQISMTHRLRFAVGGLTYAEVGRIVGCSAESVRRYLQGQLPSVEFIYSFCSRLDISPTWLILGVGEFHLGDGLKNRVLAEDARLPALPLNPLNPINTRALARTVERKPSRPAQRK